ncbi:hypothetical protein QN277_016925 [Acacia crassicarpa]|uniref:AAA+ ATPase domain-containing protein n=1 Tax=Acacia crassicarpa TaxID=499986 RepID=A0AAE1MXP4_9FABA|nr:hypothetical protein QN277_016925 [Acacia crassicarpa]
MTEIALAVVAKLAEYLVDPLVRQGQYLFCAGHITQTLETEKQKLASTQDGVQRRVREALNKTEKVVDGVVKWLAEVESHMDEVQKLEQQMKESNSCFQGRCPTWTRYRLCRQMTKMIEATKNLNQRSEFNPFCVPAPLPGIEYFSSGNFVNFQSRELVSDQLLLALQDNGVRMIGLYGMGGSGKTTLVKEVGKRAKESNLFDRVIFATVSQTVNIRKIQGEIADMLSLRLDEESEAGRARRLSMRLSNGERTLVILDDVWTMIDLKDVGIPFEDYCKVLLTTRLQSICNSMDCEEIIPLHLLSEEESWILFQKHARNVDESLASVARGIVSECKGLPIAIQAIGASLRGKYIEEWKEALRRLRDSKPIDVEPGVRDAFSCLQLSYDYLRRKEAKSLFLMCCMYPEDADISLEDLFRIVIGLGMCEELGLSLEDARNRVRTCINHLVDSCLLMRSEKMKDHLRMHDTIRDVALWISSQQNRTIVVNLEKDMKVTAVRSLKDCYAFTSWCSQASQFPQLLDAPKLEILLLTNVGACELSEECFRGMRALKVVQIESEYDGVVVRGSLFPSSMNFQTNLRTLRLRGWELGDDLSWVLSLKALEVLDLKYSSFKDLPQGLEELSKLKMLDLSRIKEQSFKIIERSTQLQEVYASEIQLTKTTLKVGRCCSNNAIFPRLKRYQLLIGNFDFKFYHDLLSMDFGCNSLCLRGFKISTLSPFIKYLLQQADAVCLYEFSDGCKNIVPDIVQVVDALPMQLLNTRMNELTSLWLRSCSDLECLADITSQHIDLLQVETLFFPKLMKLKLEYLANLKEIWRGPLLLCFFEKLQELYISDCPLLTSLLPKSVARASLLLQKLTIARCSELLNIIEEDGDGSNREIISTSNNAYLVFSKLKSLTIMNCDKLQYVLSNSYVQGLEQLEEVHIVSASQLKYALGHHENVQQEVHIKLPILRSLELRGLKNLLRIFPKNFHSSCPCFRELHWVECPKFNASCVNIIASSNTNMDNRLYDKASASLSFMEELEIVNCSVEDILFAFDKEDLTERNSHNQLILPLNTMILNNLLELKFVWRGPMGKLSLQNLKRFKVSGCNNLRTIFSPIILKSLPLLEVLEILDCNELEEIMSGTEVEKQHQGLPNTQSLKMCFPNLQSLVVERCNKLKCLFLVAIDLNNLPENILPNLRGLTLEEVPSLKDFCQGLPLSNDRLPQLLGSKMTRLTLGSLSEVWLIWRAPSHILNLVHLQHLSLSGCNELEYVFGEGFHASTLPKLEYLVVKHCNKLSSLLSTSSVTLLFPHLYEIEISECEELEEVFIHTSEASNSDSVKEIVLPNLREISLEELPSLVDICKGFKLSATNLGDIYMSKCPKFSSIMGATSGSMRIFLKGKEALEIDANSNSNQLLHQLPYFYPEYLALRELELQDLSELSFVCTAFTSFQNLSFHYLYYLEVVGCGKLKCILSMFVWGSLPQLRFLEIKECEEVEEIMKESKEVSNSPFPILERINVKGCNKLKCLFRTASVGMLLPKLEWIKVSEAAQMEELFSHTSSDMQQIELPNLNTLELSKLPALTHFCKGLNLNAPYLHNVQINECPNFDFRSHVEATSLERTALD